MAEVYDNVPGVPGYNSSTLPNGDRKTSRKNQLERYIALQEPVQRALIEEGMKVFKRADFRLKAAQERNVMVLREQLVKAIKTGQPSEIERAQANLNDYLTSRTQTSWEQADVDFHITMYRPKGEAFHAGSTGDRDVLRRDILKESLKR